MIRVILFFFASLLPVSAAAAPQIVQTARERAEILHLIRKEKLDLILPGAMRDNNVDMWIHVVREADPDPMQAHFGPISGYAIFTDRAGSRIERALFGAGGHPDFFDIFGSRDIAMAIAGYEYRTQDFAVYDELRDFIAERDPGVIAVNTSDWLSIADGISHSQWEKLDRILGPEYSSRIVSAENVITDFRVRRVQREVVAFANALEIHRQILERSLSNEVIEPGVTTLGEVGWWVREEFAKRGMDFDNEMGVSIPRILYSDVSLPIDPPDVRWWIHHDDYVIQRGDFLTFDVSLRYLDYFSTDYKRNAYLLREGEETVPESIQHAYDQAIGARAIIREQIEVGKTAEKTLADIVAAL